MKLRKILAVGLLSLAILSSTAIAAPEVKEVELNQLVPLEKMEINRKHSSYRGDYYIYTRMEGEYYWSGKLDYTGKIGNYYNYKGTIYKYYSKDVM